MKRIITVIGGIALAHNAAAFDPSTGFDIDVLISGATASQTGLRDYIVSELCDSSAEANFYSDDTGDLGADGLGFDQRFAVACLVSDPNLTPSTNARVLFKKNGSGGSGSGAAPVCDGILVENINPEGGACTASGTDTATGASRFTCEGVARIQQIPEVGISDLAPNELLSLNTSSCDNVEAAFALPFGVMVTRKLRDALQLAQGIRPLFSADATWGTDDDDVDGIPNEEEGDNQPSLSAALFTALTTGSIARWNGVLVRDPNNGGALTPFDQIEGLTDWNIDPSDTTLLAVGHDNKAFGDNRVTLCHRVPSSGTRAETEVVMNRVSCTEGARRLTTATLVTLPPTIRRNSAPVTMPENSGSSNMARCMTNMNAGVNYNTNQTSLPSIYGGIWAIGHNSLDAVPVGATPADGTETAGQRDGYRYIKLDGRLGTYENIANGSYPHYSESTVQWENSIGNNEQEIAAKLANDAVTASILTGLGRNHAWGRSGLMAFGTPVEVGGEYDINTPVTPLTRSANNCLVAVKGGTNSVILENSATAGSP